MINTVHSCGKMHAGTVFLLLLLALIRPACAAAPPNSGTILHGVKPPTVQQQAGQAPAITVEGQAPAAQQGGGKLAVSAIRIGGESPVPESELLKLINDEAGKELTLSELNDLARKITQYLRHKGFLVAFAYIPAQDIRNGVVEITAVPGKYGQIKVTGAARISPDRLKDMLFAAKPGMIITRIPLERALLLLSDLFGISVKATLTPGDVAGTADLVLEAVDTAPISGAFYADNWGSTYTGGTRYGAQATVNNISQGGDAFSFGGLTTGKGINAYNLGYESYLGDNGAKIDIHYTRVGYTLGEDFAALGATGQAAVISYSINYPFIRSRAFDLYGRVGYDVKHLHDDVAFGHSYTPRVSRLWSLGLSGNFADNWLGGGTNAFGLTGYRGKLTIDDAAALANDTASTNGDFSKTVFTWQRQQYVAENLSFNFNFTGQLASKNLDSSEKLYLGGADGVRAFPQGEATGDEGYKLTGEFRWRLPGLSSGKDNLYLNAFYDYGSVINNRRPWAEAGDSNRRSLMGVGLGVLWTRSQSFALRLDYAWKIGGEQATADTDKNGRVWLQGVSYF